MPRATIFVSSIVFGLLIGDQSCPTGLQYRPPTGREIYVAQCAGCHGEDGKGNSSALGEFPRRPADLTVLSRQNGGSFPAERIRDILSGQVDVPAHHYSNPMPIWGDLFEAKRASTRETANERLQALLDYLQSIQKP